MLSAEISARRKNGHTLFAKLINADDGLQKSVCLSRESNSVSLPNWKIWEESQVSVSVYGNDRESIVSGDTEPQDIISTFVSCLEIVFLQSLSRLGIRDALSIQTLEFLTSSTVVGEVGQRADLLTATRPTSQLYRSTFPRAF